MQEKLSLLLSPWSVISGMLTGIVIGLYFTEVVPYIEPIGEIYLSILMMCVIPILASAVVTSIGKLVNSKEQGKYIKKIVFVFIILLITVSAFSVLAGLTSQLFIDIDIETQRTIGEIALDSQESSSKGSFIPGTVVREIDSRTSEASGDDEFGLVDFIVNIIPENIFTALADDKNLQVIFFFLIFGIMLKYISREASKTIMIFFEGVFTAFQKLIKVTMYFLPFGLTALVATQFSQIGFAALLSLLQFIFLIYFAALVIFLAVTIIIWKRGSKSYREQFKAMGETLMISLGTRNSFAAIPSAITALSEELKFDTDKVNLAVPLGVSICRFGNVMVFSLGAIFAAQLYGYSLRLEEFVIIIIVSVLAGMATSGAPGLIARTMIAMVLTPLGIPSAAIIALLLAIDPVIDPVTTVINVYPNLGAAALIAEQKKK
ncbi:MAG: dicarboxylate/amino acid:cation symporter [Halanaerobiales bacterium]